MSRFSSFVALLFAFALIFVNVEGCSRRRNNRFPGITIGRTPLNPSVRAPTGTFTVVTRKPTDPPTFAATRSPTSAPTPIPTPEPTPQPTPPPPPNAILGFQPTPDRGTVVQMMRPRCVKSSEWKRKDMGMGMETDVKEVWTYTCSFNVYVTVDLGTINEPTPCACGVKLENPAPASQAFGGGNSTTRIDYVRLVVFDEVTKKVVGEINNFPFEPSKNMTDALAAAAGSNSPDYSTIIAGFAGVAKPFPNAPSLLDQSKPNQQSNVPALCFQVTQTYTTEYQWPEPPPPVLEQAPNLFSTSCIPWDRTKPLNYKRQITPQSLTDNALFWKEFLVFAKPSSGVKNRYITSFYNTNANDCGSEGGVASFDRQFTSEVTKLNDGNAGVFSWKRTYTDVFVIAGAPKGFSQVNNYLTDGYYKISWTQKYTLNEQGQFVDGLLAGALLGQNPPACNGFCGARTLLCNKLPSDWKPIQSGTRPENSESSTYLFPVPNDGSVDCKPAFTRCAEEKTFIAFQNFGGAARDFSKIKGSHLFTGPRDLFCTSVESVVLDSLEFKPLQAGAQIKKRGESEFTISKRSILQIPPSASNLVKVEGTNKLMVNENPPQANLPQASEIIIRPGTGSANAFGQPGGDHPVQLFPESYVAPMSVRTDESGCGSFSGNGLDDYCVASQLQSRPPCLPGQRGCSCRSSSFGSQCDIGLDCSPTGFCLRSECPIKSAGCACDASNSCAAGLSCESNRCVYPKSNEGQAGFLCNAQQSCNSPAQCEGGVCIVAQNADGKAGGYCNANIACPSGFNCDKDLSMCLTSNGYCIAGSGGCNCASGRRCAAGFECNANNQCTQYSCPEGTIGCPCGSGCGAKLTCKGKKLDGSDKICVGEVNCKGNQLARCETYCGAGNVKTCPLCDYQTPVCHVPSSASSVVASLALVILAIAMLF